MQLRIAAKLTVSLAAGVALTALVMGVASHRASRESLRTASVGEVLAAGLEKEAAVRGWFTDHVDHLRRLAEADESVMALAGDRGRFGEFARGALGVGFRSLRIVALEPAPTVVAASEPRELGRAADPAWARARRDEVLYDGGRFVFVAPIYDASNRRVGLAVGEADVASLATIVARRPGVRRSFDAVLAGADGRLLVGSRRPGSPGLGATAAKACAQHANTVLEAPDGRGEEAIAAVRWIDGRDLCLVVQLDAAEAYAPVAALGRWLVVVASLVALAGGWIAYLFSRLVTSRLRRLERAVRAFRRGEDARVDPAITHGDDELALLAAELDRMMAELKKAQQEASAYAARLEQRVKDRTAELEDREERFRTLAATTFDPLVTVAEDRRITLFNAAAERAFDLGFEQVRNRPVEQLFDRGSIAALDEALGRSVVGGAAGGALELNAKRRDGRTFPVEVSIAAWTDAGRAAHTLIIRDITERRALVDALRDMSLKDELTGLHNRRGFLTLAAEHRKRALRRREPISLLYLDLDGFKAVNDRLGHETGDRVLQRMARALRLAVRDTDVVARLGGDEFVALLVDADAAVAGTTERRLAHALEASQVDVPEGERVGYSLGQVVFEGGDNRSLADLMAEADERMYSVKRSRKNGGA